MAALDHVIRIERDGMPPRWVQTISHRDDMGCTVTWHLSQARLMSEATAQRHAARLQRLLGKTLGSLSACPATAEAACCA